MAKKEIFDDSDGVWRTVGGKKIFIRNGQDLASAMKESGKFSRVARHQNLYKETSEEKETETSKEKNTQQKENNDEPSNDKNYGYGKKTDKIKVYDEKEIKDRADDLRKNLDEYKDEAKTTNVNRSKEKKLEEVAKEIGESKKNYEKYLSEKKEPSDEVELINMGDGKYATIRKGEKREDVVNAFNKREREYRENLRPEVYKALRAFGYNWDQDLVDAYIEMNEEGLFQGEEKDKYTRDMKTMAGEPLYSPDRHKKRLEEYERNKSNSSNSDEPKNENQISNALRQKAYQKYLKEHPNSEITFEDFKKMIK
jgi:hypothetical protein